MNQEEIAKLALIHWLSHKNELGKEPAKIEFTKKFIYDGENHYIFRFIKNIDDQKWMLGLSGGYKENETKGGGHIFSDFKDYCEETEENDAIQIIKKIQAYWMERGKEYDETI